MSRTNQVHRERAAFNRKIKGGNARDARAVKKHDGRLSGRTLGITHLPDRKLNARFADDSEVSAGDFRLSGATQKSGPNEDRSGQTWNHGLRTLKKLPLCYSRLLTWHLRSMSSNINCRFIETIAI